MIEHFLFRILNRFNIFHFQITYKIEENKKLAAIPTYHTNIMLNRKERERTDYGFTHSLFFLKFKCVHAVCGTARILLFSMMKRKNNVRFRFDSICVHCNCIKKNSLSFTTPTIFVLCSLSSHQWEWFLKNTRSET